MKYKRVLKSEPLPCGSTIHAVTRAWSRDTWNLREVPAPTLPDGDDVIIASSSIPGIIKLLKELYENTPKRYR